MNQVGRIACAGVIALSVAAVSHAANLASDDAADVAYSGGWTNGSNGGSGFGAWVLSPTTPGPNSGHFIGSSTANGDGADDGNVGGLPTDGDINSSLGPVAWGMYANSGNTASAIRPFTGGPLDAGQTFSIDFDNGYIEPGGRVIVGLLDAFNSPIFQVGFIGGSANYFYLDAGGGGPTAVGYGDEGLNLSVTMTGSTNYTAVLTRRDGTSDTWSGTMSAAPEAFGALNVNSAGTGGGPPFDFFINNMSIVPEPSTIALAALGLIGVAVRYLRRRED